MPFKNLLIVNVKMINVLIIAMYIIVQLLLALFIFNSSKIVVAEYMLSYKETTINETIYALITTICVQIIVNVIANILFKDMSKKQKLILFTIVCMFYIYTAYFTPFLTLDALSFIVDDYQKIKTLYYAR